MLSLGFLLLGIGLLLTGINLLSDALKRIGSREFFFLASRYISPRWKALLLGVGAGAALQSTSAAMFILASLIPAGSVTASQAISILTGFSVGNCLMPFLISLPSALPLDSSCSPRRPSWWWRSAWRREASCRVRRSC